MPDPVNPMGPEFGTPEIVPAVKQEHEIERFSSFKKEMEKKATIVTQKENQEQTKKQTEEEQKDPPPPTTSELLENEPPPPTTSILDVQKPNTSSYKTVVQEQNATPKTVKASITPNAETDLSQGNDPFTKKLPDSPHASTMQEKTDLPLKKAMPLPTLIQETEKKEAPLEKKETPSIKTEPSLKQGNTFSDQKPQDSKTTIQPTDQKTPLLKQNTPNKFISVENKPLLDIPTTKPLLSSHVEPPKITIVVPSGFLTQDLEPLEKKPLISPTTSAENPSLDLGAKPQELPPPSFDVTGQDNFTADPLFTAPLPAEIQKKEGISNLHKESDKDQESGIGSIQEPSEPESSEQDSQKDDSKERERIAQELLNLNTPSPLSVEGTATPSQGAVGFDRLPPHVLDLFDRIVGVITVLQVQGKTETTIRLNENQSSLLKGVEVTITTFDTAPLAYNIELSGPPQTTQLLQKNVEELKRSFKDKKKEFNFQIQDIKISLKEEKNT